MALLVQLQNKGRSIREKACTILENTYIIINLMLVQIVLKVPLVRAQKELRNMLLETGGKELFIT